MKESLYGEQETLAICEERRVRAIRWAGRNSLAADNETIMYNFQDSGGGNLPVGNLLMGKAGNLFGAASEGGAAPWARFSRFAQAYGRVDLQGAYEFSQVQHDASPNGSLVMDTAGNPYGSTAGFSSGGMFELSPNGSGSWRETVPYVFDLASGHTHGSRNQFSQPSVIMGNRTNPPAPTV